jgi:hypothetical protein
MAKKAARKSAPVQVEPGYQQKYEVILPFTAATLVLFTAMISPVYSAGIAILLLVALGLHKAMLTGSILPKKR